MVSLQCDIHIFSTKEDLAVRDTDFGCYKYYDKAVGKGQLDRPYTQDKATFAVGRGQKWFLDNKRPDKVRSSLKELEDLLGEQSVVFVKWRSKSFIQILLNSGVLASIWLNKLGDLGRIILDRYLVGKLQDHVTDICFTSKCLAVTYLEAKVTIITFNKSIDFSKFESLSQWEPKIHVAELLSPPGRRLDRRIVISDDGQQVVFWWPSGDQEVFPWSPQMKDEDRANLMLFSLKPGVEPKLQAFYRTMSDPLYFRFLADGQTIHYLGQVERTSKKGETQLENTVLGVEHEKHIRRKVSRSLAVSNHIVCHALIPNTDIVILGSVDGTIFIFDQVENKVENQVKAGFIPHTLIPHPDGALFFALCEKGLVQCFDIALSPLRLSFSNEEQVTGNVLDLSQYFRAQVGLKTGVWYDGGLEKISLAETLLLHNNLLLVFQGGPLALLRVSGGCYTRGLLGPLQLVSQYLKYNMYHQVLLFLNQLSWAYNGQCLLMCLTTAFNTFLKLPYSREKECLVEMCLGLFHAPVRPIPDEVRDEFAEPIHDLTRRFFHHLVRHSQLVKGFQLAIDINDYDLFMDIHHAAARANVPDLANASLIKAKTTYGKNNCEEPDSPSVQSIPTPMQIFTVGMEGMHPGMEGMHPGMEGMHPGMEGIHPGMEGIHPGMEGMHPGIEGMQPGMDAIFLKTTAAKKISTSEFRGPEFAEIPGCQSLRYDSIVALPRQEGPGAPGYDSIVTLPRTSFQEDMGSVPRQHRLIADVQQNDQPTNRISSQTTSLSIHQTPSMPSHQTVSMASHQTPSIASHQTPTMASHQTPSMASHHNSSMPSHQTPTMASHQTPSMASHQTPNMVNLQTPMAMANYHPPVISNQQTSNMSNPQTPSLTNQQRLSLSVSSHPVPQSRKHSDQESPNFPTTPITETCIANLTSNFEQQSIHPSPYHPFQAHQPPPQLYQPPPQEFPWGHHQQIRVNMQPPSQGYQSTRMLSQVDKRHSPQQLPHSPQQLPANPEPTGPPNYHPPPPPAPHLQYPQPSPPPNQQGQGGQRQQQNMGKEEIKVIHFGVV